MIKFICNYYSHYTLQCDDEVQIRKLLPDGFCEVWRERDQVGGLVPINFLKIECN